MSEHYKIEQKLKFGNMINTIIQSFENKKLVKFRYNSKDLLFEPIKLIHYIAKWYVIGIVIDDPGIGKKIRCWEEGECLLTDPLAVHVITDTMT